MSTRKSRWSNEATEPVTLTDGDMAVFRPLNRFRYLRCNYISEMTGRPYGSIRHRLDDLQRLPNVYLDRPEQQRSQPNANYRHLIYELADKGAQVLKDQGLHSDEPRFGDQALFAHSMMVNDTMASIELAAGHDRMIYWPEIAGRLKDPKRFIPVTVAHTFPHTHRSEALDFNYYNDSNGPFGIRYPDRAPLFLSLEAEHSNQNDCNNLKKTSFLKKFLAVQFIMNNRLYEKHWGIPNLLTLVVVGSQARIDNKKQFIMEMTGGKGSPYFLFRVVPTIDDAFVKQFLPMPELFTGNWQRAGYPDFNLSQPDSRSANLEREVS